MPVEIFEPGDTVIDVRVEPGGDPDVFLWEAVGRFPFGRPAWTAPSRRVAQPAAFVLGVYPSALHVHWRSPEVQIRALAVDNEPWPFWDGEDKAARARRVEVWKHEVGWSPEWGTATDAGLVNGSSGRWLREWVLRPLDIAYERTWLTDALPIFHVHRGPHSQGAAMADRYNPWARAHGRAPFDLPRRPAPAALVERALAEHGDRLRAEILESDTDLVITLGNEALQVLGRVLDSAHGIGTRLQPDATYGAEHTVTLDHHRFTVIPLVHPGQRGAAWRDCHGRWAQLRMQA